MQEMGREACMYLNRRLIFDKSKIKAEEIFKLEENGGVFTTDKLQSLFGTTNKPNFLIKIEDLKSEIYEFIKL